MEGEYEPPNTPTDVSNSDDDATVSHIPFTPSQYTNIPATPLHHGPFLLPMLPFYPHHGAYQTHTSSRHPPETSETSHRSSKRGQRKYSHAPLSAQHSASSLHLESSSNTGKTKRTYNTDSEKLEKVLSCLQELDWSYGDFEWFMLRHKDANGNLVTGRSRTHAAMLSAFLGGRCKYKPAQIVEAWVQSPMGIPRKGNPERDAMFSTTMDFRVLKAARPAITTLSAQLVKEYLVKTMDKGVKEESGLHTFTTDACEIGDDHYGSETLQKTISTLKETQGLLWDYLATLASSRGHNRRSRAKNAAPATRAVSRNDRPPEIVAVYALSSICFSRNQHAKLLPADKGLLLFACSANRYLFSLESRNGTSTSYHATYEALKKYAQHDSKRVLDLGTKPNKSGVLWLDNIQTYIDPCDLRIGHEAHMLIGTAATVCEIEDFEPGMLDLEEKRQWLAKGQRAKLTFDDLWDLIDHNHLVTVMVLQWLTVLVDFVPELKPYAVKIRELRVAVATKNCPTQHRTKIFPLSTNSYNETITAELNKSLRDFLGHLGQSSESFLRRLILAGGDGLTYERMVQLKNYLQFQENDFDRLDILEPFLETWHTIWTDLSRTYEAHWVSLTSNDPSTIGYGANSIKRKAPGNVSKVDYYPYMDLLELQLEARMIDIWRIELTTTDILSHFKTLGEQEQLPTFDTLYTLAKVLHEKYRTTCTFTLAFNRDGDMNIKSGRRWTPPKHDVSSAHFTAHTGKRKRGATHQASTVSENFKGDETLAWSTRFICDAMLLKQATMSIANGDVGSVWECLKMMTFTFAGSSHTKYTSYLLEMICNFELESGPKLRKIFFDNWLVNPSGKHGMAGDLLQEQLQDELYEHIGSKDSGFDSDYVRKVIAPNVYRFMHVKKDIHSSLGLALRSGNHITPSKLADLQALISMYESKEVHLFREGRTYKEASPQRVDDFGRGIQSLQDGRLDKWIQDSCRMRMLNSDRLRNAVEEEDFEVRVFDELPEGLEPDSPESAEDRIDSLHVASAGRMALMVPDEVDMFIDDESGGLHNDENLDDEVSISEDNGGLILGRQEYDDWEDI